MWFLVIFLLCNESKAFDPFTIQATLSTISSVSSSVSDVTDLLESTNELRSELSGEERVNALRELERKTKEVESLAYEIGYTPDEVSNLLEGEINSVSSITGKIRQTTALVRRFKRIRSMFGETLETRAQKAEVDALEVQKEQANKLEELVVETKKQGLVKKKEKLEEERAFFSFRNRIKDAVIALGGRYVRADNVVTTADSKIIDSAIDIAKKLTPIFISLMFLGYFARVAYYQVGVVGKPDYQDLIKDMFVASAIFMAFPLVITTIQDVVNGIAGHLGGLVPDLNTDTVAGQFGKTKETLTKTEYGSILAWLPGVKYFFLGVDLFNLIVFLLFKIGFEIIQFLMIVCFPLVVYFSQVLNFAKAWTYFIGAYILIACWPIYFNMVSYGFSLLAPEVNVLISGVLLLLVTLIKLLAPFMGLKLLKGGDPVSSVSDTVRNATQMATGAYKKITDGEGGSGKGKNIVEPKTKEGSGNPEATGGHTTPSAGSESVQNKLASAIGGSVDMGAADWTYQLDDINDQNLQSNEKENSKNKAVVPLESNPSGLPRRSYEMFQH